MSFPRLPFPGFRRPAQAGDDDRALLARFAAAGDEAAFALLVERHGPLVRGVCRRVLGDAHLADDAFQATFFLLARKAAGLRLRAGLANWLYTVARRAAVRLAKREGRAADVSPLLAVQQRTDVRRSPEADELLRLLDEELGRLPDRYRGPLVACFLRARTQDEAAREFGWSVSTLRRRLARGRELLRARLTARGATLGAGLLAGTVAAPAAAAVPADLARAAVELAALARAGGPVDPTILALASEGPRMSWKVGAVAALVAAGGLSLTVIADGGRRGSPPPSDGTAGANPAARLVAAPVPAVQSPWVTVKGRVVVPKAEPLPVAKLVNVVADKEHCLSKGPITSEEVVVNPKTRGVKNVWVYLRPDDDDLKAAIPREKVHPDLRNPKAVERAVDQPCCQFVPRVVAARAGDTVRFKNSSPIPHNVNFHGGTEQKNETFNVVTPAGGAHVSKPLVAERGPLLYGCSIHPWMKGYVVVFDHPYYAVTDDDGKFEIKLAPAGKWRIVYRHEGGFHKGRAGSRGFPVDLKDVGRGTVELPPVEFEWPKP